MSAKPVFEPLHSKVTLKPVLKPVSMQHVVLQLIKAIEEKKFSLIMF